MEKMRMKSSFCLMLQEENNHNGVMMIRSLTDITPVPSSHKVGLKRVLLALRKAVAQ